MVISSSSSSVIVLFRHFFDLCSYCGFLVFLSIPLASCPGNQFITWFLPITTSSSSLILSSSSGGGGENWRVLRLVHILHYWVWTLILNGLINTIFPNLPSFLTILIFSYLQSLSFQGAISLSKFTMSYLCTHNITNKKSI